MLNPLQLRQISDMLSILPPKPDDQTYIQSYDLNKPVHKVSPKYYTSPLLD